MASEFPVKRQSEAEKGGLVPPLFYALSIGIIKALFCRTAMYRDVAAESTILCHQVNALFEGVELSKDETNSKAKIERRS